MDVGMPGILYRGEEMRSVPVSLKKASEPEVTAWLQKHYPFRAGAGMKNHKPTGILLREAANVRAEKRRKQE
jgi:hypothetical protein